MAQDSKQGSFVQTVMGVAQKAIDSKQTQKPSAIATTIDTVRKVAEAVNSRPVSTVIEKKWEPEIRAQSPAEKLLGSARGTPEYEALKGPYGDTELRSLGKLQDERAQRRVEKEVVMTSPAKDSLKAIGAALLSSIGLGGAKVFATGARIEQEALIGPVQGFVPRNARVYKGQRNELYDKTIELVEGIEGLQQKLAEVPQTKLEKQLYNFSNAAGSFGVGIAAFFLTKNPSAAAAVVTALDSTDSYNQARKAGKTPAEALGILAADASVTFALEKVGWDFLIGKWKTPLAKQITKTLPFVKEYPVAAAVTAKVAGSVTTEATQEGTQTWWQNLVAKLGYDKSRKLTDGIVESMIYGGILGGGATAVSSAVQVKNEKEEIRKAIKELENSGMSKEEAEPFAKYLLDYTRSYVDEFKAKTEASFKESRTVGFSEPLIPGERPGIEKPAPLPVIPGLSENDVSTAIEDLEKLASKSGSLIGFTEKIADTDNMSYGMSTYLNERALEIMKENPEADMSSAIAELWNNWKAKSSESTKTKSEEFKVGDVLDPQDGTNMVGKVTIREISGNTIKFTDSEGTEYSGMQRSLVRNLVKEGSWQKVAEGSTKFTEDPKAIAALESATIGKGEFKIGEVYEQDLGSLGKRGVIVSGINEDGSVEGYYFPTTKSAEILGQAEAYLEPAKFNNPKNELRIVEGQTDESLKELLSSAFDLSIKGKGATVEGGIKTPTNESTKRQISVSGEIPAEQPEGVQGDDRGPEETGTRAGEQRGRVLGSAGERSRARTSRLINEQARKLVAEKETFTEEEKAILRNYTGAGGLEKAGETGRGLLDEYYTPPKVIDKMWALARKHGFSGGDVLEPSAGIGRFIERGPSNANYVAYEIDETSSKIAKALLGDKAEVVNAPFENLFIDRAGNKVERTKSFDLVIGNPPYGEHRGYYKGLGEEPKISRYEDYFIKRGLDLLDEGGTLVMVVPSGFLKKGDSVAKTSISELGKLVEAYRLPERTFGTTAIGTDILVFKKNTAKESPATVEARMDLLSNDGYFAENPGKVLGEVKTRKNRFGIIEQYVERVDEDPLDLIDVTEQQDSGPKVIKKETVAEAPKVKGKEAKIEEYGGLKVAGQVFTTQQLNDSQKQIWKAKGADGSIDISKIDQKAVRDLNKYKGKYYDDFDYLQGNIYEKLDILENEDVPNKDIQREKLESVLPTRIPFDQIHINPKSEFAQQFMLESELDVEDIGQESLVDNFENYLRELPTEAFAPSNKYETMGYLWNRKVDAGKNKILAAQIKQRRKRVAENLFSDYLKTLDQNTKTRIEDDFNRTKNGFVAPDYKKVPLFIDGMDMSFGGKGLRMDEYKLDSIGFLSHRGTGINANGVGLGKTMMAIISTEQDVQKGWYKRPLFIVPKGVYKKWIDEIQMLFPKQRVVGLGNLGVKFNIKSAADIQNKIKDGDFTIVTYEALAQLGFEQETTSKLSADLNNAYSELQLSRTARERELKIAKGEEILGKGRVGGPISVESLGFDNLIIDEAHNFKNIFSRAKESKESRDPNKGRWGGLTGPSSNRGVKAWFLSQYIQGLNNGRGVKLLTATPFTNNPLEFYNMLSLVGMKDMRQMGIENINTFMDTFLKTTQRFIVKPGGSYAMTDVVEGWQNKNVLTDFIKRYVDFKDGADHGVKRPEKISKDHRFNPTQQQIGLLAQAQELLSPAFKDKGGALLYIDEAKKTTLSPFLSRYYKGERPTYETFIEESPKLQGMMALIKANQKKTGQVIYFPMGVDYMPLVKDYLVKKLGYKEKQVGIIHGQTNDNARDRIKKQFNEGSIKVIIGTDTIKEGVDLQELSTDLYITSYPWRPTDIVQVEGRIHRQGNNYDKVRIHYLSLKDSVDAFLFQKMSTKVKRLADADALQQSLDTEEMDYEDMVGDLITDPAAKLQVKTQMAKDRVTAELNAAKAEMALLLDQNTKLVDLTETIKKTREELVKETEKQSKKETPDNYWLDIYKKELRSAEKKLATLQNRNVDPEKNLARIQELEVIVADKEAGLEKIDKDKEEEAKKLPAPEERKAKPNDFEALEKETLQENKTFIRKGGKAVRFTEGKTLYKKPVKVEVAEESKEPATPLESYFEKPTNALEKFATDYMLNNYEQAKIDYEKRIAETYPDLKTFFVSADDAKYVIPNYKGEIAASYHEASSGFAKAIFDEYMEKAKAQGKIRIAFTAGGTGAGKTTALIGQRPEEFSEYGVVYDTNLTGDGGVKKVELAFKNGFRVNIHYVYRDVVDSFIEGVIPRVRTKNRIVAINEHIKRHAEVLPTIDKLTEKFSDEFKVGDLQVFYNDNTHGKGGALEVEFDKLPIKAYDEADLRKTLYEETQRAVADGRLTEQEGRAISGGVSEESGELGVRQTDEQGVRERAEPTSAEGQVVLNEAEKVQTTPEEDWENFYAEQHAEQVIRADEARKAKDFETEKDAGKKMVEMEEAVITKHADEIEQPDIEGIAVVDDEVVEVKADKILEPEGDTPGMFTVSVGGKEAVIEADDINELTNVLKERIDEFKPKELEGQEVMIESGPATVEAEGKDHVVVENEAGEMQVVEKKKVKPRKTANETTPPKPPRTRKETVKQEEPESEEVKKLLYTKFDKFRLAIQDRALGVAKTQKLASEGLLPEELDIYLEHELYSGAVTAEIEEWEKEMWKPIAKAYVEFTAGEDSKKKTVQDYLRLAHAPEYNKAYYDGAAGITTQEAEAQLREIEKSPEFPQIEELSNMIRGLAHSLPKYLLENGLIKKEEFDAWNSRYENYVPYNRILPEEDGFAKSMGIGKGFDVRGKEAKARKGSDLEVENIFESIRLNWEKAIVRSNKNKVAVTAYNFAKAYPKIGIFKIVKGQPATIKGEDGEPMTITIPPRGDNIMVAKIKGVQKFIEITDKDVATALKNLDTQKSNIIIESLRIGTRFISMINTSLNPEFFISNMVKDIQSAALNTADKFGLGDYAKNIKNLPSSYKGVFDYLVGKKTEGAKMYEELNKLGGTTGYFNLSDREAIAQSLDQAELEFSKSAVGFVVKNGKAMINGINLINEVVENGTRLAVYKLAIERGYTPKRSAQIAKNATVNFNKHGTLGPLINALYAFSNAGIQGTTNVFRTLSKPKTAAKVAGLIAVISVLLQSWNRGVDEEEYDKLPDYVKETNWVIMFGDGRYFKIGLPWGYNVLKVATDDIYEMAIGKRSGTDSARAVLAAAINAYNPIGGNSLLQSIMPTLLRPFADVSMNEAWYDAPVYPMNIAGVKDSLNYYDSDNPLFVKIASQLSKFTGGDLGNPGLIEVTPGTLEYLWSQYTGGIGRFFSGAAKTGVSLVTDPKNMQVGDIPFVRKFLGKANDETYNKGVIYDTLDRSKEDVLPKESRETFINALKLELEAGRIQKEDAVDFAKDYDNNQDNIQQVKDTVEYIKKKKMDKNEKAKFFEALANDDWMKSHGKEPLNKAQLKMIMQEF